MNKILQYDQYPPYPFNSLQNQLMMRITQRHVGQEAFLVFVLEIIESIILKLILIPLRATIIFTKETNYRVIKSYKIKESHSLQLKVERVLSICRRLNPGSLFLRNKSY